MSWYNSLTGIYICFVKLNFIRCSSFTNFENIIFTRRINYIWIIDNPILNCIYWLRCCIWVYFWDIIDHNVRPSRKCSPIFDHNEMYSGTGSRLINLLMVCVLTDKTISILNISPISNTRLYPRDFCECACTNKKKYLI